MLDFFDEGNQKNLTINFGATYLIHFTKPKDIKFNWEFNKKRNKVKNAPKLGEKLLQGSGGNYLSNEIFYRVAKLRKEQRPELSTGHFHISMIQNKKEDFSNMKTKKLLRIVRKGIENGIDGL